MLRNQGGSGMIRDQGKQYQEQSKQQRVSHGANWTNRGSGKVSLHAHCRGHGRTNVCALYHQHQYNPGHQQANGRAVTDTRESSAGKNHFALLSEMPGTPEKSLSGWH
jgi:hypothetical protein